MSFAVDIPGTGDDPISLTYTYDVSRFVATFLDEPTWEELTLYYGERTTWNKFIKVAEEVTGDPYLLTH